MSLADQVRISRSNFATNIVLWRGLGLSDRQVQALPIFSVIRKRSANSFVASPVLQHSPLHCRGKKSVRSIDGMAELFRFWLSSRLRGFLAIAGATSPPLHTRFFRSPHLRPSPVVGTPFSFRTG